MCAKFEIDQTSKTTVIVWTDGQTDGRTQRIHKHLHLRLGLKIRNPHHCTFKLSIGPPLKLFYFSTDIAHLRTYPSH
jgi:hypothetical protein